MPRSKMLQVFYCDVVALGDCISCWSDTLLDRRVRGTTTALMGGALRWVWSPSTDTE